MLLYLKLKSPYVAVHNRERPAGSNQYSTAIRVSARSAACPFSLEATSAFISTIYPLVDLEGIHTRCIGLPSETKLKPAFFGFPEYQVL